MTEPLVNLRQLLHGPREHRVEYVVTGAGAMLFYGYVRNTEDLDIAVAPDEENLDRVAEWLTSLDAVLKLNPNRRLGPRERWGTAKGANVRPTPAVARTGLTIMTIKSRRNQQCSTRCGAADAGRSRKFLTLQP